MQISHLKNHIGSDTTSLDVCGFLFGVDSQTLCRTDCPCMGFGVDDGGSLLIYHTCSAPAFSVVFSSIHIPLLPHTMSGWHGNPTDSRWQQSSPSDNQAQSAGTARPIGTCDNWHSTACWLAGSAGQVDGWFSQ